MPYYKRPDGTIEIEMPNGERAVTAMTEEQLQRAGVMPASRHEGGAAMDLYGVDQPQLPSSVHEGGVAVDMGQQESDAQLMRQLNQVQAPRFAPGPAPAVAQVQRQIDARRGVPTARFGGLEMEPRNAPQYSRREGGTAIDYYKSDADRERGIREQGTRRDGEGGGSERANIERMIKQTEDELDRLRGRLARLSENG